MPEGVRIDGLKELRKALKDHAADAPKLLNREIKKSLTLTVLPKVNARTPVGKTGRLARRNRIVAAGAKVGIANSLPYANARHWGRFYWPNRDAPERRRSPVKPAPFIWDTVEKERPAVLDDIRHALDESLNQFT
jgi:hypothetical protein